MTASQQPYVAPPPPGPSSGDCAQCPARSVLVYRSWDGADFTGPTLCATCYRTLAHARNRSSLFSTPCDACSAPYAFRDPSHRRNEYLCTTCHLLSGYTHGARALAPTLARYSPTLSESSQSPHARPTLRCEARGYTTDCHGQVKPRGGVNSGRQLCDFHADPLRYLKRKG